MTFRKLMSMIRELFTSTFRLALVIVMCVAIWVGASMVAAGRLVAWRLRKLLPRRHD